MVGAAAKNCLTVGLFLLLVCSLQGQGKSRHDLWETQLQAFVSTDGRVNYPAWSKKRHLLDNYIQALSEATPQSNWQKNDILAYWINAYNALTVQLIIDHYPVKSIKDIPKRWSIPVFTIGEKSYSLGDIEHKILRKQNEKRIHFAINCASTSCPNLYRSAFKGSQLDYQLETVTRQFFRDTSKNKFESDRIRLSKILLWFIMDFGFKKEKLAFLSRYAPIPIHSDVSIRYLPYDWSLNE